MKWVGIDVSKAKVTVFVSGSEAGAGDYDQPGELKKLVKELGKHEEDVQVVMESTGGYERALHRELSEAGIACSVLNPARARFFMRSLGKHAKSDPIDAALLCEYGERMTPGPTKLPGSEVRELEQLVQRRAQLLKMKTMESNHAEHVEDRFVRSSTARIAKTLQQEVAKLDQRIAAHIAKHEALADKSRRMQTVCGVGPQVANGLLAHMPELGSLRKPQAAALSGLAPYVAESGIHKGKRRIRGGRSEVRKLLYMAAMVASRHNPAMKRTYQRLIESGKPKKVAIIAVARKLIVMLNAMLQKEQDWAPILLPS